MARSDGVVGEVRELASHVDTAEFGATRDVPVVQVVIGDGHRGQLDMRDPRAHVWIDVLTSLHATGRPAYVEIEPDTQRITELLLPLRFLVGGIRRVDDGLEVDLVISHARHYLRRSNERFDELRAVLEAVFESRVPVLVTESSDVHEIIDVRPTGEPADDSYAQPIAPPSQA